MQEHRHITRPIRRRCLFGAASVATLFLMTKAAIAQDHVGGAVATLLVPRNLSYWAMFVNATAIVKLVIIMLLASSLVTWSIWLSKVVELRAVRRRLAADIVRLESGSAVAPTNSVDAGIAEMLRVSALEVGHAGSLRGTAVIESAKDRISVRLFAIEGRIAERMLRGTSVLATVGAIAPFVGLFGTVWGIMNSFIGISQSNTTNLAVVAPGIAEALLATAMGLVAAIPAVVMYNHVVRAISGIRRQLSEASAGIACLRSRELDAALASEAQEKFVVAAA